MLLMKICPFSAKKTCLQTGRGRIRSSAELGAVSSMRPPPSCSVSSRPPTVLRLASREPKRYLPTIFFVLRQREFLLSAWSIWTQPAQLTCVILFDVFVVNCPVRQLFWDTG